MLLSHCGVWWSSFARHLRRAQVGFGGLSVLGSSGGHSAEMRPISTVLVIEESYSTRALAGANK